MAGTELTGTDVTGAGLGRAAVGQADTAPAAARCPLHPGSRVVRNGTAVTGAGRVQKYFCQPPGGPRHTFTTAVPGDGPGSRPPRGHRYDAAVIARALHALSRGATYRQARIAALGERSPGAVLAPANPDAKLVSRWLDSFAPLLRRELTAAHAPSVTVARAVLVGRRGAGSPGPWLLCLAGWDPGAPPRVWPAILADRRDESAWAGVFRQSARPALLLCDSPAQEAAAIGAWGPAARLSGPGRVRAGRLALLWQHDEAEVSGHAMPADLWAAEHTAPAADTLIRRLAGRAATIRAHDRAGSLVSLMALEVSGLATAESMTAIIACR